MFGTELNHVYYQIWARRAPHRIVPSAPERERPYLSDVAHEENYAEGYWSSVY
jgi:hypothetical protein